MFESPRGDGVSSWTCACYARVLGRAVGIAADAEVARWAVIEAARAWGLEDAGV